MKSRRFKPFALGSLLVWGPPLAAQVLPDAAGIMQDTLQGLVERQVEQAQGAALERAAAQAEAAAGGRALERAEALQAELVQNQALEQVQNQVERVQAQASGQAEAAIERVQADGTQSSVAAATVAGAERTAAFAEIALAPGVRAVEFEWIMRVTPEERALLNREAAELLTYLTARMPLANSGEELLTFTVPPDLDAGEAILQLVPEAMRGRIDRNHIYELEGWPR